MGTLNCIKPYRISIAWEGICTPPHKAIEAHKLRRIVFRATQAHHSKFEHQIVRISSCCIEVADESAFYLEAKVYRQEARLGSVPWSSNSFSGHQRRQPLQNFLARRCYRCFPAFGRLPRQFYKAESEDCRSRS